MSAAALEAFLARLYVDGALRARFVRDPHAEARRFGLADDDVRAVAAIDFGDLARAAASFGHKRAHKPPAAPWWRRLVRRFWGRVT